MKIVAYIWTMDGESFSISRCGFMNDNKSKYCPTLHPHGLVDESLIS